MVLNLQSCPKVKDFMFQRKVMTYGCASFIGSLCNFFFYLAVLPGGKEETMPARPGHTHSEDLPWVEVPHPLSAAEEEPDNCGSMVPSICGEVPDTVQRVVNGERSVDLLVVNCLCFPSHSNKRNTKRSRVRPRWCSPTPEDGRWALSYSMEPLCLRSHVAKCSPGPSVMFPPGP